jgi:protein-tyrosine-phosphatase
VGDAPPGAVLFACNFNQVRSPMALALMRLAFGDRVFVDSCGLRKAVSEGGLDPFAAAAIEEVGGDLEKFKPKTFGDLEDGSFDVVISLTPEAHHRAGELARRRAIDIEYWPTPDPTLATGPRDQRLLAYRDVRDRLEAKIRARFGEVRTFGG